MKLPATPLLSAAGSVNVSYRTDDVGLAANNPALLQSRIGTQLSASFTAFPGSINHYSLTGAYHSAKWNTTFGSQINYLDYGSMPLTDAAGNMAGDFRPADFAIQLSAGKRYLERWSYGATVKFIHSSYGQFRSSAIAVDMGVLYFDSIKNFAASFIAKNMGAQLNAYAGEKEELPFDLQVGFTKRLEKAPFGFSVTAQHLHRFKILYNDTLFNRENGNSSPGRLNQLFNHFVIASHIYLGQNLEATIGFNQLRRQELSIQNAGNGLTGFSAGLRIKFSKLQILYARSTYQRGISYNQIAINANMNKLIGLDE